MNTTVTTTFSAQHFVSTVRGTSGGEYASWFFHRVRELTTALEKRLDAAIEFTVEDVSGEIRRTSSDLAILDTMLRQLEDHCRNLAVYKQSLTTARLRIAAVLSSNKAYIDAASNVGGVMGGEVV